MAKTIAAAMTRILAIQSALAITSPVEKSVLKAWPYVPPASKTVTETPAFLNDWTLDAQLGTNEGFGDTAGDQHYIVHMRLVVKDSDEDQAAAIATAFMEEIREAFKADPKLNGAADLIHLRGVEPTLTLFEHAGLAYVGLDLELDVYMRDP